MLDYDFDFDLKLCLCTRLLGRAQFKPWGVKKNSVPYMTEIVPTNVYQNNLESCNNTAHHIVKNEIDLILP